MGCACYLAGVGYPAWRIGLLVVGCVWFPPLLHSIWRKGAVSTREAWRAGKALKR